MAERYSEDGEFVERFRREAQAAARLNHPNIIAVYDRGEADGRPYIAMEYLQGRTLKQVIQAEGPLPPERAIAIAMQMLAGLRYAHEHGVVHRDVKPHNVLVGDDGRIKVTDFGIAHAGDPQMTEVGSIVGHRPVPLARAGARSRRRPADRHLLARASCSTRCSPAACRSRAIRRSRSRCSTSPTRRRRCARSRRTCPNRSRSSSRTRCSRTRRSATAAPTSSRPTSTACGAASCPSPRRPRTRRHPARADRARARGRGHAHRAAARGARRCSAATTAACAPDAAQALALAVAAGPAAAARGRRARGVRDRRRSRRRLVDDDHEADDDGRYDDRHRLAHARRPRGQDRTRRPERR